MVGKNLVKGNVVQISVPAQPSSLVYDSNGNPWRIDSIGDIELSTDGSIMRMPVVLVPEGHTGRAANGS
jgi:hypothetical protein